MGKDIHSAAARGYATAADAYVRGRPEYPDDAVRFLVEQLAIKPGTSVLDLGAGTGKFTRALLPTGARLVAVEPVEAMRRTLASSLPNVEALAGTAEAIPLGPGSVDAVVVAQSFHWFDGARALDEIHRVLRPGGRLGLIWNARDESVDWVARLTELIDPHEAGAPRYKSGAWRKPFAIDGRFGPLQAREFRQVQSGPPDMVVDRVASISFIAALTPVVRERVLSDTRALVADHPGTRGRTVIELPYRTDVFICDRRD